MTVAGAEVELIEGAGGVFEIMRNEELLFSKRKLNRFPDDKEVDAIIAGS